MKGNKNSNTASCPDCGKKLRMRFNLRLAQKVTCPNCWAYLEVVSVNPLRLSWDTGEYEEEWDDRMDREDDWF